MRAAVGSLAGESGVMWRIEPSVARTPSVWQEARGRLRVDLETLDAEDAEVAEAVVEVVIQLQACWHPHDPPDRLHPTHHA
jgi:hypothetical protein